MKLKIKVKRLDPSLELPKVIDKGEWVDLRSSVPMVLAAPYADTLKRRKAEAGEIASRKVDYCSATIRLGVAMKLPKGFEAILVLRSSAPKKYGIIMANGFGVIDSSYCGNNDEWKCPIIAYRDSAIKAGDRICQFRIQLSQKATIWQKIKWLLSSGIEIQEVDNLSSTDRGGFGTTGNN
jgi:dUTP pyrophosphatase